MRREEGARPAGFTLAEVLVAVVLLAVGLLAVASASVAVLGESRRASWRAAQTLAADRVLGEAHARGTDGEEPGRARVSVRAGGAVVEVERRVGRAAAGVISVRVVVAGSRGVPADSFATRLARHVVVPGWAWEAAE